MEYTHADHMFGPVFGENARILILGSFPSVKSREQMFYYGHRQNRFWKVLSAVYGSEDLTLRPIPEKKAFLLARDIALWDVVASCDIQGSSDSSIRNIQTNPIHALVDGTAVRKIILNGGKAFGLFEKYCCWEGMPPYVQLPSTSPANAAWKLERLVGVWKRALLE